MIILSTLSTDWHHVTLFIPCHFIYTLTLTTHITHFFAREFFFKGTFYNCGVGVHTLIVFLWLSEFPFYTFYDFLLPESPMFKFCRKSYFLSFLKSLLPSIFLFICFILRLASFIVYYWISLSWSVLRFLSMFPLEVALERWLLCLPSILGTKSLSISV